MQFQRCISILCVGALFGQAAPPPLECSPCIDRPRANISVVVHGTKFDDFWRQVLRASQTAAQQLNVNFEMQLFDRFSTDAMVQKIQQVAERRPQAMVVTLPDAKVGAAIKKAIDDHGVRVVSMNSGYADARGYGIPAHVGMHEYNGGLFVGEYFEREFAKRGIVLKSCVYINHEVGNQALQQRQDGFDKFCSGKGLPLKVLEVGAANINSMRAKLKAEFAAMALQGVALLCGGSATVAGVLPELRTLGAFDHVVVATFDYSEDVRSGMQSGEIMCYIDQNQWLQGYLSVIIAALWGTTGQLMAPDVYMTGPAIITTPPDQSQSECLAEAFPVCKCPWGPNGNESLVKTAQCTPLGAHPGTAEPKCQYKSPISLAGGTGCADYRQLKFRGITHGTRGDAFWYVVKAGAEQAARDLRLADFKMELWNAFSTDAMAAKIRAAAADPTIDGIFTSMPGGAVEAALIEAAKTTAVVTMNSGYNESRYMRKVLGVNIAGHIGMDEFNAGYLAGRKLVEAGAQSVVCFKHEFGNSALDARCNGLKLKFEESGLSFEEADMSDVNTKNVDNVVDFAEGVLQANALADAVLTAGAWALPHVLKGASRVAGRSFLAGSFDTSPDVLAGIEDGKVLFGVDQQQYLQGYMSVITLFIDLLTGLRLAKHVTESGPFFVEKAAPEKDACIALPWDAQYVGDMNALEFTVGFPECEFKGARVCPAGQELNATFDCVPCQEGFYSSSEDQLPCFPCQVGTMSQAPGASYCEECPVGRYQGTEGQPVCLACAAGKSTGGQERAAKCNNCQAGWFSVPAAGTCSPCEYGFFGSTEGLGNCTHCGEKLTTLSIASVAQSACVCAEGHYGAGVSSAACSSCPAASSTATAGSVNVTSCLCKEGLYMSLENACESCLKGMTCREGSSILNLHEARAAGFPKDTSLIFPLLKQGFYSTRQDPSSVYICGKHYCPGGFPGSCSGGRDSLTCTACVSGSYWDGDKCTSCDDGRALAVLGICSTFFCTLVMITCLHIGINWPFTKASKEVMTAALFVSMAITVVLAFGVYGTLSAVWVWPLSDFFEAFSFLSFDLELVNMSCIIEGGTYAVKYVIKLLMYPAICFLLCLSAAVLNCIPIARPHAHLNAAAMQNTLGFLMSAIFVSICIVSLDGLRCWDNPNGKMTLVVDTSVVCWDGSGHVPVVVLSILALLAYPVAFLSLTFYMAWCYPMLSNKYGTRFTSRARFFSNRMRPDCILLSFGFNARNFCISLAPVVASTNYAVQIGLLMLSYLSWLVIQVHTQCWRFIWLNMADTAITSAQVVLLLLFSLLADDEAVDPSAVGWLIIAMLTGILGVTVTIAAVKFLAYLYRKQHYDVFITHHKAAADLYARHLKTLLQTPGKIVPFLDVDELENLDNLMFAVKMSKRLLVVLTNEVLRRPWCAVEIVCANLNKVPIVVGQVRGDPFCLTKDYVADVIQSFSTSDWGIFSKQGITEEMLTAAYDHVLDCPLITLRLDSSDIKEQEIDAQHVLGPLAHMFKPPVAALDPAKIVHVIYDHQSSIQCSAAFMLKHLFRERSWDVRMNLVNKSDSDNMTKAVVVTLMSKGLVTNNVAIGCLVALSRNRHRVITVLCKEGFWKPEDSWFQDVRRARVFTDADIQAMQQHAPNTTGAEVARVLGPLYKILAWNFSPELTQQIMRQEFQIIEQRAVKELEKEMLMKEALELGTSSSKSSHIPDSADYDEDMGHGGRWYF